MARRVFALNILTLFKFSFVRNLKILDSAYFLCLIASLQSSLCQGLLSFGFVEVLGIHFSLMSIREEVKSAIGLADSEIDKGV